MDVRADFRAGNVADGNISRLLQLQGALALRFVSSATAFGPPRALITAATEVSSGEDMTHDYLKKREAASPHGKKFGICRNLNIVSRMSERRESGGKASPAARRFRAVMAATSLPHENATAWATRMGLGPTAVSNFRNGIPVSKMAANRIADKTGISTDYLLRGNEMFLTVEMRQRIQTALEASGDAPAEPPDLGSKGQDVGS